MTYLWLLLHDLITFYIYVQQTCTTHIHNLQAVQWGEGQEGEAAWPAASLAAGTHSLCFFASIFASRSFSIFFCIFVERGMVVLVVEVKLAKTTMQNTRKYGRNDRAAQSTVSRTALPACVCGGRRNTPPRHHHKSAPNRCIPPRTGTGK